MKIVVTGSVAYDYLMKFPGKFTDHILPDQLHQISLSFLVESMVKLRGGTAAGIAYTQALLGGNPTIMAAVGNDFADYGAWLEEVGVDTSAIRVIKDKTCASFFANTDSEQNQIASFYTGAMAHAGELSFEEDAPSADLIIISPNDPVAMQNYVREAKQLGLDYIYDPSQQTIWLSGDDLKEGLEGCYMLAVNEYEMGMIEEKTGLSRVEISEKARGVLVTKGKNGSELLFDGERYEIPIVPISEAVDPTGAGDAYRAGMMRGIQLSMPWEICGRMGALASAYVLESNGPIGHSYTIAEFIERYRQNFDDNGALDALLK
ncbi:MAG: adenosine kinase [Cellvibrionaceae bacterium]|jgi:adenosine kinase